MKRIISALVMLIALLGAAQAADKCLGCHADKTPGVTADWKDSAHAKSKVQCVRCHGEDVEAAHDGRARVTAEVCGGCHAKAFEGHKASKHAVATKSGRGCTRSMPEGLRGNDCGHCHVKGSAEPLTQTECAMFLAQSPEMQRQGCGSCHQVENRCDTCHTKHGTDLKFARQAETCGVCHMGPDHAQYEMWRTSIHGALYLSAGEPRAPTCVTCHMPGGAHDVSATVATGKDDPARDAARGKMVKVCARCHTEKLAGRSLADADRIEAQSRALLVEAQGIVSALAANGLLMPPPAVREPHPIFGGQFVIGPHMLYEDISSPEAKFFRMMMFYYMSAFKGAFHQNPDYAHWYGNAPLKLTLSDLRSEAALLNSVDSLRKRVDNLGGALGGRADEPSRSPAEALKVALRALSERRLKGEITEEEYQRQREALLHGAGL